MVLLYCRQSEVAKADEVAKKGGVDELMMEPGADPLAQTTGVVQRFEKCRHGHGEESGR